MYLLLKALKILKQVVPNYDAPLNFVLFYFKLKYFSLLYMKI